jgi:flavin reductase (DIM6/NTAB) family NADH-FMN oxidoreductase RutF
VALPRITVVTVCDIVPSAGQERQLPRQCPGGHEPAAEPETASVIRGAFPDRGAAGVPGTEPATNADAFRRALARHPAGVTIVTLRGRSGPLGLTVTSFTSASLEPPLVSFYIGHGSSNWPEIRAARHFAVNLIGAESPELAARFARKGEDRFAPPTRWRWGAMGLPLLVDATTHVVCATHTLVVLGDHDLVVGRVIDVAIGHADRPLLRHQGRFTSPSA